MPISAPSRLGSAATVCSVWGCDAHQQCIDDRLVVKGDLGDGRGEREDHMKVWNWQQIGDSRIDPFAAGRALTLRAMAIAARIIGDAGFAAIVAGIDVTSKPRCPACFDGAHDASFATSKMTGVLTSVGAPVSSKDVGDFEGRPNRLRFRRRHLQSQSIERAGRRPDGVGGDLRVTRCCR